MTYFKHFYSPILESQLCLDVLFVTFDFLKNLLDRFGSKLTSLEQRCAVFRKCFPTHYSQVNWHFWKKIFGS